MVSTTVNTATQFDLQTVVLSVCLTLQGTDLVSQRVDLLRPDGGYVTYATTSGDGRATYEVLPEAQHRLRSTYGDVTWISDVAIVARLSPAHCPIWDLTKRVRIVMGHYPPGSQGLFDQAGSSQSVDYGAAESSEVELGSNRHVCIGSCVQALARRFDH